jgi:hypothetical protein
MRFAKYEMVCVASYKSYPFGYFLTLNISRIDSSTGAGCRQYQARLA